MISLLFCFHAASKNNIAGKSREELALEKQMELERRLMDVSGQLNSGKKPAKTKRKSSVLLPPRAQSEDHDINCTTWGEKLY